MTVYADHASTSYPTLFFPAIDSWGNPSNHHSLGRPPGPAR